jgi:hypothetical protein
MKKILLAVCVLLTAGCDASTVYAVKCDDPTENKVVTWSEDKVISAMTLESGTRVYLKDGTLIDYSPAISCTIKQRDVEDK